MSYFKNFGSSIYSHATKDVKKKLEPTIELGIFVGYSDTPHNYRAYLPAHMMTVVKRDVKFDEDKAMQLYRERDLELHAVEELLVPKDEPQDVEKLHEEDHGLAEPTHTESSTIHGRRCTTEADRLSLDPEEHVGAPTSLLR